MLRRLAEQLGHEEAFGYFRGASAAEEDGDMSRAIALYKRAFRLWPALDSGLEGDGVPRGVLHEAAERGIDCAAATTLLSTEASPRFPVSEPEKWLAYLDEHGYCVVAGVADAAAVARGRGLLWDFLEAPPETRVRREDPATWGVRGDWLPSKSNGLLGGFGFGQSEFAWSLRLLPGVRAAFSTVWGTDDLLVSFDGGNVFLPWSERPERRTEGSWWHVDQNAFLPGKDGRVCVQGLVTLTDATAATGGLCVIPGSHRQHRAVCERAGAATMRGDFVPVEAGDEALAAGGRLVTARAGDLLLWDSRCVHCNAPGDGGGDMDELLRVVGYVCMTPSAWAAPEVLEQRRQAFLDHVSTSHWPPEFHGADAAPPWMAPRRWRDASAARRRLVVGDARFFRARRRLLAAAKSLLVRACPLARSPLLTFVAGGYACWACWACVTQRACSA